MERESFEDIEVADVINKHFISIKVDREERPDIDHIYMMVCQAMTGSGGWPLTIIMTPDKKPFFAGTYFPKRGRMGFQGLIDILERVAELWSFKRDSLVSAGESIAERMRESRDVRAQGREDISEGMIHEAYGELKDLFDQTYGGFGKAPKFPIPHKIHFLLRYYKMTDEKKALDMAERTLEHMYRGGMYDHIGFGFSRYSTDRKWLVPHFEKMLYDNALLAIAYLEAYQVTGRELFREVAENTFTYVLRDMTHSEGGFYTAEDADSEGEEGKFYVWTPEEVMSVLGDPGREYCKLYDITGEGNFEGKNIPNLIGYKGKIDKVSATIEKKREKLFEYREKRIHPHKDDKILTAWNGMMIAAMSVGSRILGKERYREAAEKAADFIFRHLVREDRRLLARYRDGEAAYLGYLDDYAYLVWGLIELYEAGFNPDYLKRALELNDAMLGLFWDEKNGGFFLNARDAEELIFRPKEIYDGATPAGNSVAALNMIRLARLTGRQELEEKADALFKAFGEQVKSYPSGYAFYLIALMFAVNKGREVIITGETENRTTIDMLQAVNRGFNPFTVVIFKPAEEGGKELEEMIPFLAGHTPLHGEATAYVCENFGCRSPIINVEELGRLLQ